MSETIGSGPAPRSNPWWPNPIFRRYARSRLRPQALGAWLLVTVLLAGFLYFGFRTGTRFQGQMSIMDAERATVIPLLVLQALILFFLGTGQVAAGITAEADEGTLDYQRLSPLTPLGKVLGYLLGLPVREWCLFAATLPFTAWALWKGEVAASAWMPVYLVLLAQGGEFGFVVFQTAAQAGVVDAPTASFLVAAVAVSMLLAPLLLLGADRWWVPKLAERAARAGPGGAPRPAEINEPQTAPVIIAGFGRYGQIVGRLLNANGLSATVLEHDAEKVETVRRFGWPVFYGDATRLDLLRTAGAARARVLVLAIDDVEQSLKVVALVREHFPQLTVVARARNVTHYYRLRQLGVTQIERETLDASLMSGRRVLELMGWQAHTARNQALRFRAHNIDLLEQMAPHLGDEQKLIALSKQGRRQLETMWAQERAEQADRRNRQGWQADDGTGPAP